MSDPYLTAQAELESVVLPSFHLEAPPYAVFMGFGARLAAARKALGLTQSDLGKGLGTDGADVGKQVVYGWEKDQHFPRVDQLMLLCKKLKVSADWLLFGDEAIGVSQQYKAARAAVSQLSDEERLALFAMIQAPPALDHEVEERIPATRAKPATNAAEVLKAARGPSGVRKTSGKKAA